MQEALRVDIVGRPKTAGREVVLRLSFNGAAGTVTGSQHLLEAEGLAQTVNFSTKDTAEAIAAFLQKRPPNFTGR